MVPIAFSCCAEHPRDPATMHKCVPAMRVQTPQTPVPSRPRQQMAPSATKLHSVGRWISFSNEVVAHVATTCSNNCRCCANELQCTRPTKGAIGAETFSKPPDMSPCNTEGKGLPPVWSCRGEQASRSGGSVIPTRIFSFFGPLPCGPTQPLILRLPRLGPHSSMHPASQKAAKRRNAQVRNGTRLLGRLGRMWASWRRRLLRSDAWRGGGDRR